MHRSLQGRPPLGPHDVHVWLVRAPESASPERAERCAALLSADETARMNRFRFAADRMRYLFAHALAREALSRYAPARPPAAWRFRTNAHGRPEIVPDEADRGGAPPLRFNLSHTAGLVACAVTLARDVGVDVENAAVSTIGSGLDVAALYFAPAELAGLAAQPREARRARFFALWTLKEAYIKARGMGLALPLAGFAFDLDAAAAGAAARGDIPVRFEPELQDDGERWHFARLAPTPAHALALAARREPGERLTVSLFEDPPDAA